MQIITKIRRERTKLQKNIIILLKIVILIMLLSSGTVFADIEEEKSQLADTIMSYLIVRDQIAFGDNTEMSTDLFDSLKSAVPKKISVLFHTAKSAEIKEYLAGEYLDALYWTGNLPKNKDDIDKELIDYVLEQIPFSSSVYSSKSRNVVCLFSAESKLAGKTLFENGHLEEYINKRIDSSGEDILFELVDYAMIRKDTVNGKKYFSILKTKFPEYYGIKFINNKYNLDGTKKILIGNMLPDFELPNVEEPSETISMQKLRGKYVLIDLWYIGCPGCMIEIPKIEEVYKKFEDKNFVIYSIGFDTPERLQEFRKKPKYSMPWLHSVVEGSWFAPVVELLETVFVPHAILVAPDGKIIELDCSSEQLEKSLTKYIGE
jgi:peroxiredoxin